jgi:hypothetical protein
VTEASVRALTYAGYWLHRADNWLETTVPVFWHPIRLQVTAPRHHRFETQEYEHPYRSANSHVLRLFGHRGVVVGWWQGGGLDEESPEYEAHLNQAVQGRTLVTNERFRAISDKITYQVVP